MPARLLLPLAVSTAALSWGTLASAALAQAAPSPPADAPRAALEHARARSAAAPASAPAQLDLAQALQHTGQFSEALQALARAEGLQAGYPAVDVALSALLTEWHAADPPRPGQASAYADACAGAKLRLGAPDGDRLAQLTHGTCVRLASADLAADRAASSSADGKPVSGAQQDSASGLTPDKVLRIWVITALGAAIFIGGATWLTRKQRYKGPPKS